MFGISKAALRDNATPRAILLNMLLAAAALFVNGFGIYLAIRANIGVGPWEVLNLGAAKTFGVLYGTASVTIAFAILVIDVLLREPIGIAMFIDAVVVGKTVDFFNWLDLVRPCSSLLTGVPMMLLGMAMPVSQTISSPTARQPKMMKHCRIIIVR